MGRPVSGSCWSFPYVQGVAAQGHAFHIPATVEDSIKTKSTEGLGNCTDYKVLAAQMGNTELTLRTRLKKSDVVAHL